MTAKEQLIEKLKLESQVLKNKGVDVTDHEVTLIYLKTGTTNANPDNFDLLCAAMYDFECLCSDYGCKNEEE